MTAEHKPHSRRVVERVWFWIDQFASADSLLGRGNDEHWEIEFRGSDLWNLRHAVEDLVEQLEATEQRLAREISEHADAQAEYRRLVEQFEGNEGRPAPVPAERR